MRLKFTKGDIGAVLLVLALVIVVFVGSTTALSSEQNIMLEIYQDGALLRALSLAEDCVFQVEGDYRNTICVKNGRAAILSSNCPGRDCVRSGWTKGEKSIVCLPNHLQICPVVKDG